MSFGSTALTLVDPETLIRTGAIKRSDGGLQCVTRSRHGPKIPGRYDAKVVVTESRNCGQFRVYRTRFFGHKFELSGLLDAGLHLPADKDRS
jgi:hypothetical protein